MGKPAEAVSALCNRLVSPRPCSHSWLVCLSECCHGDGDLVYGSRIHSIEITSFTYVLWYLTSQGVNTRNCIDRCGRGAVYSAG